METTSRQAREILERGLKSDSELLKELATVSKFVAAASAAKALGAATAVALILESAGAAIAAAANLVGRFRSVNGPREELTAYEQFAALFYLTAIKAYIEALASHLRELADGLADDKSPQSSEHCDVAAITATVAAVDEASLTYLFAVTPLTDESPLFSALEAWLTTLLDNHGVPLYRARSLAVSVEKSARTRFRVFLAGDDAQAQWMRNYLALSSDVNHDSVLSDLRAATEAIAGWLDPGRREAMHEAAWDVYREFLRGLPGNASTMYGETFGVSKVFQSPVVGYHVARPGRDPSPAEVTDIGRLLGALVSNRTPGHDLIILAGGPGSGKSTLCRVFASELAESLDAHPIFLQLRRLREGDDIPQYIEEQLLQQGLVSKLADLLSLPNVVVILDGFDELVAASRSRLRQFFNVLRDDMETGALRNAKVVVSGRDTLFPGGKGLPPGSHVLSLRPLDALRVKAWGERWRAQHPSGLGGTFHPEHHLENPGATSSPLHQLVTWPLTLHLVARVHTAGGLPDPSVEDTEIEKAYLYRSILSETATRQTQQTAGEGRLSPDEGRDFLRAVAWLMYTKAVDSLDVSEVAPLITAGGNGGIDPSQLAELAVLNAPELAKGEETGFEFVHKSFSEFLVAEVLAEKIERAAFEVAEFDSDTTGWRMSDDDAAGLLGEAFGQRLLPAEIQEMLEPMLGAVISFRKGTQVKDRVSQQERDPVLKAIVRRSEALYKKALTGADLGKLDGVARNAPAIVTPMDALANYTVGLVLTGSAAAKQMLSDDASGGRRFDAEQGVGGLWRFLSLCHAGGVTLDEGLARRMFKAMTVAPANSDVVLTEASLPWDLVLLRTIEGFDGRLAESTIHAAEEMRAHEAVLLAVVVLLYRASASPPDEGEMSMTLDRYALEFGRGSALEEHFAMLARLGLISRGDADHFAHMQYSPSALPIRELLEGRLDIDEFLWRVSREAPMRASDLSVRLLHELVREIAPRRGKMSRRALPRRGR